MEDFLEPDFDPSSLRVPQLRSLLLRFNVALPSTARKADLVDAFHTHVASRASDIRASRARQARVKPNGKDIIDMTGAAQTQTPHQAEGEHAPAKKPAKRTARLSAAAAPARVRGGVRMGEKDSDEEPEQAAPVEAPKRAKAKPRQSAPAAVSNRQSRASMLSPGRDEERIPEIKEEQVPKSHSGSGAMTDEEAFSDFNPFQSGGEGSSPAPNRASTASRAARRKTIDGRVRKEPSRLSNEAWSDNDKSPEKSQAVMPKSRTTPSLRNYMDPVVAASTPPRIVSDFVRKSIARMSPAPESKAEDEAEEPKEDEEDAEEEEELDEGDEADISRDEFSPPPPKSHLTPSASRQSLSRMRRQSEIKQAPGQQIGAASKARQLLWTALLLVFLSYGTWYMQESKALGFCDPRSASNSIVRARHDAVLEAKRASSYLEDGEVDLDGPLLPAFLRPSCTPCPSHGICANGELEGCADSDYVLRDPLLAHIPLVRSIVPPSMTAPTCVPDTHRLVLAAELAGAMNHRLAIWRGSVECGTAPHTGSSKKSLSPSLPEDTLRADLAARRDQTVVDDAYFAQLWTLALDDALRSGAIVRDASGQLLSTDAIRPMSCRVRLAFDALIRRVRLYLVVAAALVGLLAYARAALRAKRAESRRVAELVQLALERLQEQEYAHAVDPVLTPEPYLAPSHLRDHILRAEHSARARARLWTRVARVVEENANVRTRQAQRRGEWLRVWEWVGPVGTGMSRATGGASASASASAIEDTLMRATDREMVGYGSSPATSPIKMTDSERQSQRHFVA